MTLLLGSFAPVAVAANYSYPATYKGTTTTGGTVEFSVSADGTSVTRFEVTQVLDTCGVPFSGTADGAVPIIGESFSKGGSNAGPVFTGTFAAPDRAEGTVAYRIVKVRDDGCYPKTVSWTATAPSAPLAPPQVPPTVTARPRVIVSYRQEGGIGGPRPSLVVSGGRRARVTLGRCTAKFELQLGAWNRLRVALRRADLPAIAGDYPPPKGADEITYVIRAGRNTVRIAPAPQPENEEVMRKLEPLLKALNKTVSAGERRMPPSCKSSR